MAHTRTTPWKALQKYCWEQRNWQKQRAKKKTCFQLQKVWVCVCSLLYSLYLVNPGKFMDEFKYRELHTMMWSIVWVFCMNCDLFLHFTLISSLDRRSCGVFKRIGVFKRSSSVKIKNLKSSFKYTETDIWDLRKIWALWREKLLKVSWILPCTDI